ncbi:3-oxo-5-alpha-steroid 4-dehydrogenase-domain-containing protein [Chlamydoabsidia padenii]|nr:3-oxo-5-alpha-steroid 4-dehydrogenase-domain-containing protein [Chlamydoabsidia padenii]
MLLILTICACLCILTVLAILSVTIHELRASVLHHGKLLETAVTPRTRWANCLAQLNVPKSWFTHFYIVGLIFSLYCWLELLVATRDGIQVGPLLHTLQHWDSSQGSHRVDWQVCLIGLFLMTYHLTRRLLECWFIEKPSPHARMHISHYVVGIGFYGAMVFGTWLEGVGALSLWPDGYQKQDSTRSGICIILGLTLFLYASIHQFKCHSILASLRSDKKKDDDHNKQTTHYHIPYGDWFDYLVAPHYTCDILIYVALCILYQGQSIILLCGLLWTLVNLTINASETKSWYLATFPHFPKNRWIMVPGLY